MFLILGLFVIPYYMSFLWIDDKRKQYIKNDAMYPDLHRLSVASPVRSDGLFKQASDDKRLQIDIPPLFQITEEKEDDVKASVVEVKTTPKQKQVNFEDQDIVEQESNVKVEDSSTPQKQQYRRFESRILKDYDDVYDNKRFSMVSAIQVFQKAGSYIYNMGLVSVPCLSLL